MQTGSPLLLAPAAGLELLPELELPLQLPPALQMAKLNSEFLRDSVAPNNQVLAFHK
jgi:hypothetical protein